MGLVYKTVAQDNVIDALLDTGLRFPAEFVQRSLQPLFPSACLKGHRQFLRLESFVSDVAEQVKLRVV